MKKIKKRKRGKRKKEKTIVIHRFFQFEIPDKRHHVGTLKLIVRKAFSQMYCTYICFSSRHSQVCGANNSICFRCPLEQSSSFWVCNPMFSGFLTIHQKGKKRNQVDPHSNPTLSTDKDMNNCLLFPRMKESFHF